MRAKYKIGTLVKYKSNPDEAPIFGEIDEIIIGKDDYQYMFCSGEIEMRIGDEHIVSAYREIKARGVAAQKIKGHSKRKVKEQSAILS